MSLTGLYRLPLSTWDAETTMEHSPLLIFLIVFWTNSRIFC
jgi:hypothetical protein